MRTKIVATIGPSSDSYETIRELIASGLDIARANFSHCTYDEYRGRKENILKASAELGRKVELMVDLQGPRIRVGELPKEGRVLKDGEAVEFSTDRADTDAIFIDNPYLHTDVKAGDPMFLASGDMELTVKSVNGKRILAKVVRGGILFSRKGVNVPRTKLTSSGLTEKDLKDVAFALEEKAEFIAVSFVQTAEDILKLRKITGDRVKIIAKIETALALLNIESIVNASDAVMIARGDLGVEIPGEQVPFAQKTIIREAVQQKKASITATQMLTSMIDHPHPTRAEVSDIANAVWDGTDAVMLSDETASGEYPVESLREMVKVAREAEEARSGSDYFTSPRLEAAGIL